MIGKRSTTFERDCMESAGRMVGFSGVVMEPFMDAVWRRLDKGQREYQDTALSRPPKELTHEIREEAEDVAGWALMRAQTIDHLPDNEGQLIRVKLVRAIALAVSLWQELEEIADIERDAAPVKHRDPIEETRRINAERDEIRRAQVA